MCDWGGGPNEIQNYAEDRGPADPEPITNETQSGWARRLDLVAEARIKEAERLAALSAEGGPDTEMCPVHTFVRLRDCEVHGSSAEAEK